MISPAVRVRLGRLRRQWTMDALRILPKSALIVLPGSSRRFGPPRRWALWDDYRARTKARWIEVLPAQSCSYPRPHAPPELAVRLWRDDWPAQGIAVLENARVLDAEGWPIGKRDTLLIDLATGLERPEYTAYLSLRCPIDTAVGGRALNLASCYARENYCHFLLDALPRLEMFLRAGLTFDDVDWIIVPEFIGSAREHFFHALGLPEKKLLRLSYGRQYEFSTLYQPTFPGRESFIPPWIAEFYRERLMRPLGIAHQKKTRLYVARTHRGLANDAELWAALAARSFERLEPATLEDNVRRFAEAAIIVGPHGAGLSNVIFAPPGAHLLEIIPGDRPFPYFYSAASAAGLSYSAVLATPLTPAGQEYRKLPSDEPFAVDVSALCSIRSSLKSDPSPACVVSLH